VKIAQIARWAAAHRSPGTQSQATRERGAKQLELAHSYPVKIAQIARAQPRAEDPHRLATSGCEWQSLVDY